MLESEITLHFARDHRSDLYDLASESLAISPERSRLQVDDLLDQRSICERTSTTTRTKVVAALQTSLQHQAHRLTLVSSPTHIARCLQSALTLLADTPGYRHLAGRVSAVASDTTVTGRAPGDVVILEPQTRPQPGAADFADVARAALPLLDRSSAVGYVEEWSQLTQTWLAKTRKQDT